MVAGGIIYLMGLLLLPLQPLLMVHRYALLFSQIVLRGDAEKNIDGHRSLQPPRLCVRECLRSLINPSSAAVSALTNMHNLILVRYCD